MRVEIPYAPRPLQRQLHDAVKRFNVIVAHRRFGKTVFCINHAVRAAIQCQRPNPRYGYVAPFRTQAKTVAWDYVKHFTAPIPGVEWNEAELRCDLPNGGRLTLFGADNFDAMRGVYFDGVILDEYAQMAPSAWTAVVRPALADREGWAIFIGTPQGRNSFWDLYDRAAGQPDWARFMYKASETGILPDAELSAARREMTPAMYAQEFECSFQAAIIGAVYGQEVEQAEKEGRICRVPHEKGLPVHTAWDLGIGDSTSVLMFQLAGREIRIIDHVESFGVGLDWYVKELKSRPYVYGTHLLPHDVDVKELGTGRTRRETLAEYGLRCDVVPKQKVEEGINAVRAVMSRMWFDGEKCRQAVEAIRQYRYEYREKLHAFAPAPLHDWCFVGQTKVATRHGMCPIMNLPNTGEVLTECGWKQYHSPRVTRRNAPLVAVTFKDGLTVKCTPDHMFKTASGWRYAKDLTSGTPIQSCLTPSLYISMVAFTGVGRLIDIGRGAARRFIEQFGKVHSGIFPKGATFITETGIQTITNCPISNAWTPKSIIRSHGKKVDRIEKDQSTLAKELVALRLNGIGQKKDGSGTKEMQSVQKAGRSGSAKRGIAWLAGSISKLLSARTGVLKNIAAQTARPRIIERVRPLQETADVWCLTVPGQESFALENGAVVHNCSHTADALRYLAMGLHKVETVKSQRVKQPDTTWVT